MPFLSKATSNVAPYYRSLACCGQVAVTFDQYAERAAVEAEMKDKCRITSDPQGHDDDVLDEDTLILVPPSGDANTVYEGKCSVSQYIRDVNREEGGRDDTRQLWHASIPISAPVPSYGNRFVVTAIRENGDSALLDSRFTIIRIGKHTQGVRRPLVLQDEEGETVE